MSKWNWLKKKVLQFPLKKAHPLSLKIKNRLKKMLNKFLSQKRNKAQN